MVNPNCACSKLEKGGQNEGESVAQYHVRLRLQVAKCDFTDTGDVIRSKILQTMRDKKNSVGQQWGKDTHYSSYWNMLQIKKILTAKPSIWRKHSPLCPLHEIRSTKCIRRDIRDPRTNQSLDWHMMTRRTIPANSVGWTTKALGHSAQPLEKHVVPAQRRVISLACAKAKRN